MKIIEISGKSFLITMSDSENCPALKSAGFVCTGHVGYDGKPEIYFYEREL